MANAKLHPTFEIAGTSHLLAAKQLGAVFAEDIEKAARSMKDREGDIRRALDLVFAGV